MTKIKVCGIRDEACAIATAEAGADFIGMILAKSPRQVSPGVAGKIVSALKKSALPARSVGVFVNTPPEEVIKISNSCGFDWVQLSGDEPWEYCLAIHLPVIKVFHVPPAAEPEKIAAELKKGREILGGKEVIFMLDTAATGKYGGTGRNFDWTVAGAAARLFPVFIAGGLTPGNVGEAIRRARPWGVDVSSGVETKGVKDMIKILKFIATVRRADAEQTG